MSLETKLYIALKRHLRAREWLLIGGQPPNGTDHLPVLEIKDVNMVSKGSRDSFKPDLVAYKPGKIVIFEIKPKFSASDFEKLQNIENDFSRQASFWEELESRRISDDKGVLLKDLKLETDLIFALAYESPHVPVSTVWSYVQQQGTFIEFEPLNQDSPPNL